MKRLPALLAVLVLAACSKQVDLMSNMPEPEANEVMAALQNDGIHAEKKPGREGMVTVTIDADKVGRAVDLLRARGLPQQRYAGMGQVFKKDGLISSPLEERARYLYAISQELGSTLSQIDGVIVARVHVVLPERNSGSDGMSPSSASVFIKYRDGFNLDGLQPQIRRLVNNSIPGLTPEKISIVLFGSQPLPPRPAPTVPQVAGVSAIHIGAAAIVIITIGGLLTWAHRRKRPAKRGLSAE